VIRFSFQLSTAKPAAPALAPCLLALAAVTTYFVLTYTASTGALTVSATLGGSILDITDDGTAVAPNEFQVAYAEYAAVGQVQSLGALRSLAALRST
jgi:hypothetical protein